MFIINAQGGKRKSEDSLKESVFSLYHVCPGIWTRVSGFLWQVPLPPQPSCQLSLAA